MTATRRTFLASLLAAGLAPATVRRLAAQDPLPEPLGGRGDVGALADTFSVGRLRERVLPMDNDAAIRDLELKLKCPCPCGLDIYTCRTTDFTCTYSPEAHKEILGLVQQGKTAQQIIDTFVAEYGEKALMAPKAQGFNLAGYLVPGAAVLTVGLGLVWYLRRRNAVAAAVAPAGPRGPVLPAVGDATPDELERLRRALAEDDR